MEEKFIERAKDAEFERRLKSIDLDDEEELPLNSSNNKGAKVIINKK